MHRSIDLSTDDLARCQPGIKQLEGGAKLVEPTGCITTGGGRTIEGRVKSERGGASGREETTASPGRAKRVAWWIRGRFQILEKGNGGQSP